MGRAAGAVLTAAAPEASLAARATSAGRRRRPAPADPRVTAPGSTAAAQREQIEQIKAQRPPEPATPAPATPAPASPPPASPGGGPSLPTITLPPVAQTGSGFLLGVFAWACGLAYLRGGAPEVRKFLAAKFLNRTGG